MTGTAYTGLWPACPTPLTADEELDVEAMRKVAASLQEAGVDGIWLFGSGGEGVTLSDATRRAAVEVILETTGGNLPVLVGISAEGYRRALDRYRPLADLPVAGVFSTPPIYYTYTQDELIDYFKALAGATGKDTFLYHNPFFAHTSLTVESVVALAQVEGIAGAKDSTRDLAVTQRLINEAGDRFSVFQGEELLAGASLLAGAEGLVSVISTVNPRLFMDLIAAARAGDVDRTVKHQRDIADLVAGLGLIGPATNGQFIGAVKRRLASQGLCGTAMTRPFRSG
jgi:dihydrodipicolinate synthase/N-acetylneuraminate lyase